MIRSRNYMAIAGAGLALTAAAHMTAEEVDGLTVDFLPTAKFRRRTPEYRPPEPSAELIEQRLRDAEAKRARKAAKRAKASSQQTTPDPST